MKPADVVYLISRYNEPLNLALLKGEKKEKKSGRVRTIKPLGERVSSIVLPTNLQRDREDSGFIVGTRLNFDRLEIHPPTTIPKTGVETRGDISDTLQLSYRLAFRDSD